MLLVTDCDRRFSVEDGEHTADRLTAREALRVASLAGDGTRLLVDGLPLRPGGLATVEALACRRVSIACFDVEPVAAPLAFPEPVQLQLLDAQWESRKH